MTKDTPPIDQLMLLPESAGERLRAARIANGLSLAQVAAETRIPQRHLETMEEGRFADLPARTYAVGFSRSYARLVGLDAEELVAQVRRELSEQQPDTRQRPATFEPGDPARIPSSLIGWLSLVAVVAALIVLAFAYRTYFAPAVELPPLVDQDARAAATATPRAAAASPSPAPEGPVVFTALEPGVWVKFYDAAGNQLMQKQMALGESYIVPADAQGPLLWTGRPDALAITVGGQAVPKLSEAEGIMRDVPVTAAALAGRPPPPQPQPSPTG